MEGVLIKRLMMNRSYGMVILNEGLIDVMDEKEVCSIFGDLYNARRDLSKVVSIYVSKFVILFQSF